MLTTELLERPPRPMRTRFELAALRLTEEWLRCGIVRASADDLELAGEFLERSGFRVEAVPGLRVRLTYPVGDAIEMSRESVVVAALRRLAAHEMRRRREDRRPMTGREGTGSASDRTPAAAHPF